jgi:hypothetical protein
MKPHPAAASENFLKFLASVPSLPGRCGTTRLRPPTKSLRAFGTAKILRAAKIILKFPKTLFARLIQWRANVIDLPEQTYCIIDRIHFGGASAVVALPLEKGRTYYCEMKLRQS